MDNRYKIHVYSRLPNLSTTKKSEGEIVDNVVRLRMQWDKEQKVNYSYEERKDYFVDDLDNNDAIFILVEDANTHNMIGYGQVVKENNVPTFAQAFVSEEHRTRGIFDEITKTACDLGSKAGYETLTAEPVADGKSKRVLQDNGFVLIYVDDGGGEVLRKSLTSKGEGGGRPEGMPPQSRL